MITYIKYLIVFLLTVLTTQIYYYSTEKPDKSDRNIPALETDSSNNSEIDLMVFNNTLKVEFVDKIEDDIIGQYSRKENKITIKCPKDESGLNKMYGTIAHESTHYAINLTKKKGIEDNETQAYIVGYVTREIGKRMNCSFKK